MLDTSFLEELAAKSPTPGGGGACAYCGALASALASMVGNLTIGKARYAGVEAETYLSLERLADARERLIELVEEDARAFAPLARAYGLPKGTEAEREAQHLALQDALVAACDVPLEIMRQCSLVIDECSFMALNGSRLALSDAGAAVLLAQAALEGASLNIIINVSSLDDGARAARYRAEVDDLSASQGARAREIYEYVKKEIA